MTLYKGMLCVHCGVMRHEMAGVRALVQGQVVSVCHIRDWQDGAACRAHSDCGIDGRSCRRRFCSEHGFCVTPEQAMHLNQIMQATSLPASLCVFSI